MADWEQRQLCPDGGCVGVIGPDGTCKVCGRAAPNWGDERNRGLNDEREAGDRSDADVVDDDAGREGVDADDPDDDGDGDDSADDDDDADDDGDDDSDGDDDEPGVQRTAAPVKDWQRRRLCPDGGCIGVIGADGTCPVCGKVA